MSLLEGITSELGKIDNVVVGKRCSDSPFGMHFVFSGEGWGVQGDLNHFGTSYDLGGLKWLCEEAKVLSVSDLIGIPVVVYFKDMQIDSVRVLKEVL